MLSIQFVNKNIFFAKFVYLFITCHFQCQTYVSSSPADDMNRVRRVYTSSFYTLFDDVEKYRGYMFDIFFEIYDRISFQNYLVRLMDFKCPVRSYIFENFLILKIKIVTCIRHVLYQCCFIWLYVLIFYIIFMLFRSII